MALPDFQALMLPVLKAAANGEVRLGDLPETLAKKFHLSEEERRQLLPSGRQTTLANRAGWAKTYLAKAGLVQKTRRGYFEATERGREVLGQKPTRIDINFLSHFPEFAEFRKPAPEGPEGLDESAGEIVERSSRTPDEILRATHREIEKTLQAELLERLLQAFPAFFENTIVNLLVSMGYGGSRENAGRAIGGSDDKGLDGVIDQDALGLDRVYIQAKRYKLDHAVGAPEVHGFAGSLEGAKATKGIFVTTSNFSPQARAFAEKIARRIVLIDGQQLAQLMTKHDVGVRVEETLHIKKIDEDFFSPE